jgi:hypothetical protein
VTDFESDTKVFLDTRGHGKFEAIPFVEKANGFVGTCRRCKATTEVWKIYSHEDRRLLDLCTLDIYNYIISVPSMVQKSGKIWSKDPQTIAQSSGKSKAWAAKYFCEQCNLGTWHSGLSEYLGDKNGTFAGTCDECGTPKSGNTKDLKSEMYATLERINDEKQAAIRFRNAQSAQEYLDSFTRQMLENRKNRKTRKKKTEGDGE